MLPPPPSECSWCLHASVRLVRTTRSATKKWTVEGNMGIFDGDECARRHSACMSPVAHDHSPAYVCGIWFYVCNFALLHCIQFNARCIRFDIFLRFSRFSLFCALVMLRGGMKCESDSMLTINFHFEKLRECCGFRSNTHQSSQCLRERYNLNDSCRMNGLLHRCHLVRL